MPPELRGDEEPEPPTCEGQVPEELVRRCLTFGEQLQQLKAAEQPAPKRRRNV
jgi:hypothetical protein